MALTRLNAFATGTILTSGQLTGEFDNIYNNGLTLISPLTGNLDFNNFRANNLNAGSLASPSLNFNGNTNTGLYSPASNQVAIVVAGVAAANFTAAAAGPHVIGSGTTNTRYALYHTGTITLSGATQEAAFADDQALTNASGVPLYGMFLNQTFTNVAGVTADMAWLVINPSALTITAGSVTNASGLKIIGVPSGATNNYALWSTGGAFRFEGTGPHAIGGATSTGVQLNLTAAAWAPGAVTAVGFQIASTTTPNANQDSYLASIAGSITKAGAGTHALLAGLNMGVGFNAGAGSTTTDAAQIYIGGYTAPAGTTNASGLKVNAAPTGATNNYALWVAGGQARFDGTIRLGTSIALGGGVAPTLGTIGGSGPATAGQNSWMQVIDSAGATVWIPVWK